MKLELPGDGQLFTFGDAIPFKVTVTDPEDGTIDCSKIEVRFVLGHDSHGHPITSEHGCTGTIKTEMDGGHDPNANIFGVIDASYTDGGGGGQAALTGHDQSQLQPRHRQAEHFNNSSGINTFDKANAEGGKTVGDINNDDWISFKPYILGDSTKLTARISSGGAGGFLEVRSRLGDQEDPRLRTGAGDRWLGDLPGHRRAAARRSEECHRAVPRLQGR